MFKAKQNYFNYIIYIYIFNLLMFIQLYYLYLFSFKNMFSWHYLCTVLRTFIVIDMALYKINIIIIITLMYEAASSWSHVSRPMIPVGGTSMIRLWDFCRPTVTL